MSAVVTGVVISTLGTGYAIYSAEKQKKKMDEQTKKQEDAQRALEAEAKARAQREEAQAKATEARNQAIANQKRRVGQNRSGTLLTSPLGTFAETFAENLTDTSSGKTLIGQ